MLCVNVGTRSSVVVQYVVFVIYGVSVETVYVQYRCDLGRMQHVDWISMSISMELCKINNFVGHFWLLSSDSRFNANVGRVGAFGSDVWSCRMCMN